MTPELIASIVVLAIGTAFGTYMAARRPVGVTQGVTTEEDEMSDVFTQDVLPMFEDNNAELVAKLRKAALELGAKNPDGITADDIHDVVPIPPGVDPRIMGSAFEKSRWTRAGFMASRRKANHGRPVRIWKLKDAA